MSEEWAVKKYGSVEDARWDLERDEREDDEPSGDVDYDYSTRYTGLDY